MDMLAGNLRIDRHHAITVALQEMQHAIARALGPVGRANERDGVNRTEQIGDFGVGGQRHVSGP
jgi:hypothetical protein